MKYKHIVKRGNRYYFVCRIPHELLHHFPSAVIWKSLKTDNLKIACTLATALEYQTQKLFMQLRSGMLDPHLEKMLLANYLSNCLNLLETDVGFNSRLGKIEHEFLLQSNELAQAGIDGHEKQKLASGLIEIFKKALIDKSIPPQQFEFYSTMLKKYEHEYDFKFTRREAEAFRLKLLDADVKFLKSAKQLYEGDSDGIESLKERLKPHLTPYIGLKDFIPVYLDTYKVNKANLAGETFDKVEVECRVLLEILGNISIDTVNTDEKRTELKRILKRYPINKLQRYGDKSIHSLLKSGYSGKVICPKTANNYIKRIASLMDLAILRSYTERANIYRFKGTLFDINSIPELERLAYDKADLVRLVDAICTKKLWCYGESKPERFWLILIAIYHGFRLSNITSLTKSDICKTDSGTWVFNLKHGKSKNTVRPVAVVDALILLGFVDWVHDLKREKLFQDSADIFSKWYNRKNGFEDKYVTSDKKKCLYSVRHSYAGEVYNITDDLKATSAMMGQSLGRNVTNRYVKQLNIDKQQVFTNSLHLGIDLNKLEARVLELFCSYDMKV